MSDHAPFDTPFAHSVYEGKYARMGERWGDTAYRVTENVIGALPRTLAAPNMTELKGTVYEYVHKRHFIPGGRYLYAAGNDLHQVQNCLLLRAEDSREGWAALAYKAAMSLMTGAGIGVYYGDIRPGGSIIKRTGGVATGPVPLMDSVNEQARAYVQGGNRRSAIWAGLLWSHPDAEKFIRAKDWPDYIRAAKAEEARKLEAGEKCDPVRAPLDMTNISVCLDDEFFAAYHDPTHDRHDLAHRVYWKTVDKMVTTGEPGFSIDLGDRADEKLRNACTEIVSADDSDICNLGGIVLSRFDDPQEFGRAVRYGTLFLTAGTVYSHVPYTSADSPDGRGVDAVREKNRRLGLDLIGVHEFLLKRGLMYGTDEAFEALEPFMAEYDRALEYAWDWQDQYGLSRSVAATSGAPTGTRGIIAESTTGWEPVSAAAYRRVVRHNNDAGETREVHHVVDPTVKRLLDEGYLLPTEEVEDAHTLSYDYERRFRMQAFAQSHTDQAISMTINLPHVMTTTTEQRQFGETLMKYLPRLRGITVYPDGARPGQPITPVSLEEALNGGNVEVSESEEKCAAGLCGV